MIRQVIKKFDRMNVLYLLCLICVFIHMYICMYVYVVGIAVVYRRITLKIGFAEVLGSVWFGCGFYSGRDNL